MRKVTTFLIMLCMAVVSLTAVAQEQVDNALIPGTAVKAQAQTVAKTEKTDVAYRSFPASAQLTGEAVKAFELKKDVNATAAAKVVKKSPSKAAPTTTAGLAGRYIFTYKSLTSSLPDGGTTAVISAVTADTILIENFYTSGVNVKAAVNFETGVVTIPNQVAAVHNTYGDCDIAVIKSDGTPDRSTPVTGTLNSDGSISISSWWGLFVVSGTNANAFMMAAYGTEIEKGNAVMHVERYDTTLTYDFAVQVEQTGRNLVTVKNFGNYGQTVELTLNSDSTVTIPTQLIYASGNSTLGNFYSYASNWSTNTVRASSTITATTTGSSVSFDNWTGYSSTGYYLGRFKNATISGDDLKIEVPVLSTTSFTGAGTEADPYQIKTLDDLVFLSEKVAGDTDNSYGTTYSSHTKSFVGKYFKVMNDIDMDGYRFTPIGADATHRFAATFDGDNKTISNLNVSTGSTGYAALFGNVDTVAVIKNVTLKDVDVKSSYYYTAGVVAFAPAASIENCHVTGTVAGAITTGGVVAIAYGVKNCSFEGTVSGTAGYAGGIAAQTYGVISDSYAKGTITVASSSSYPGGGVVANLYGPNSGAENCYFAGTVNGSNSSNLVVGGVAGNVYQGYIKNCYAVGNVYGYDTSASVGGVAGGLAGDISNSYFRGHVAASASRNVGGIAGVVRNFPRDGVAAVSTIKDSYTAHRQNAETSDYDTSTETRETVGSVDASSSVTVTNVYYDKQLTDYGSEDGRGKLTSELTSASGPTGFNSADWVYSEGAYPRLKSMDETDAAKLGASAFIFDKSFPDTKDYVANNAVVTLVGSTRAAAYKAGALYTSGYNVTVSNTAVTLKGTFGTDTLVLVNLQDSKLPALFTIVDVAPKAFDGNGTEADPFLIKTKADLMKLGDITTNVRQNYPKVYFKQTNDIDMELDSTFTGVSNAIDDNTYVRFEGTYDGGNYTINNIYLDYINWTDKANKQATSGGRSSIRKGLFGQVGTTGVVKNVRIGAGSHIWLWAYAGAVVGYNYGTVDNCRNYADVYGASSTIGGIVGYNNASGTISNVYNAGNVYSGYSAVGGIVGSNNGVMEGCQNVGNVEAKVLTSFSNASRLFNAGGLAGSNYGIVSNSVNAGHVVAPTQTGGVAALNSSSTSGNKYENVINYGTVFSDDAAKAGGFAYSGSAGSFTASNVYYDSQLTGLGAVSTASYEGVTPATTAYLTGGSVTGLDADVWSQAAGRYPVLKAFEDEPLAQAAAKVVFTAAQNETSQQLHSNATLSNVEGTVWKLSDGTKGFAVDGTTLTVPATESMIYDTLTVTLNDFVRPIALRAVAPNPLVGSGTEADPYLIRYPSEWNAFANYMAAILDPFDGKYIKVVNDLDFADTAFVAFAYDNVTAFAGNLLGNGKTLKNVTFTPSTTLKGAIGNLAATGVVRDLTMQGNVTSATAATGGFVGKLYGRLVNCVNEINVTTTGVGVGGFAGYAYAGAVIDSCENKATISSNKGTVGGFAGTTAAGVTFTDCVNSGEVKHTGTATTIRSIGGFVGTGTAPVYTRCVNKGEISGGAASYVGGFQGNVTGADTIVFVECHNEAPVTGTSSVAGLLGYGPASGTTRAPIYVSKCYNTGDITSTAKVTYGCAGLVGYLTPSSVIEDSYNTGAIAATSSLYTGGLWGYGVASTEAKRNYVRRSYNTGNLVGTNYVSGIGGYIPAYTTIDSCYNTGEISAAYGAAGIGNLMGRTVFIYNSWNSGNINASTHSAGGLVSFGSYEAYVSDCFNTGNVTAPYNTGGLSGRARAVFINCYNRGTVTGDHVVGGLAGLPVVGTSTYPATMFYGCYNAGAVVNTGTGATTGNVVGNTSVWDATKGNVIENTYYVTDFGKFEQDTIGGNAVTIKELAAMTSGIESPVKAVENPKGWNYGDEYSFPVIPGFANNDCAKAFAAAVVVADGDSLTNVTKNFNVGEPENTSWTASNPVISFTGKNAYITAASTAEVVLTATCGQFSAPWTIKLNSSTAVDGIKADKQIVGEVYYNVAGQRVAKPETKDGQVYIVTVTYDDGTTENVKRYNK